MITVVVIVLALLFFIGFFYLLLILYLAYFGSNFVPTPQREIEKMMRFVKKGDHIYDLGFGDGRVLESALLKGAHVASGCELDIQRYLKVWIRLKPWQQKNLCLRYGDIWAADIHSYDVVFTFFAPKLMKRLYEKVKHEGKPGTWFVVYKHPVPNIKPAVHDGDVYAYKI